MTPLGSVCGFVPPYLWQQLERAGVLDPGTVERTLRTDDGFRTRRVVRSVLVEGTPPVVRDVAWTVHDAQQRTDLPGVAVRSEGEPETGDVAVDEAAAGITATLALFAEVYQRDSFDGAGALVPLTVHFGQDYANAFWDGEHLVFGDGDGRIFGRFTAALDVLAHEFGHAVTERTSGLVYRDQSGALNESMSDVFGACVKQRQLGQDAASGDWLIGEGIFAPGIEARALRDMAAPGTAYDDPQLGSDPQPAHMDDFVTTTDDNGGVHINSGIPNRAFVLAAQAVGGSSAEGAGRIWYAALTSGRVRPDADFGAFAAVTVELAGEDADAVRSAWEEVGITPGTDTSSTSPTAPGSPDPGPSGPPTDPAPSDPAPSDPAPSDPAPSDPAEPDPGAEDVVEVRRSGGFLGLAVEGRVDLASADPRAHRARSLLARSDLAGVADGPAQPDRFVYDFRLRGRRVSVPEQELTPELAALAALLLPDGGE